MRTIKSVKPMKHLVCIMSFFLFLIISGTIQAHAAEFILAPEEYSRHVYSVNDEKVELRLTNSDYATYEYSELYDEVHFVSSDESIVPIISQGFSFAGSGYVSCEVSFDRTGQVTITAMRGSEILATFDLTITPGEFKVFKESSTLVYDDSTIGDYGYLYFNHKVQSVISSDNSVCEASLVQYPDYYDYFYGQDTSDTGNDKYCIVYPMKAGSAIITVTDIMGNELIQKIEVQESCISGILDGSERGRFLYYELDHPDDDEKDPSFSENLRYGRTEVMIAARYGTEVELTVDGVSYGSVMADEYGIAEFKGIKVVKTGKPVVIRTMLGGLERTRTGKVVAEAHIYPEKIKANAKKGKVRFWNLHKGDVLKVIINKKVVKKETMKKDASRHTLKFKSKKKLKKKQKIQYQVYNKFKQKMKTETYKVGTNPW